jgi:NAD(P)-dependent dehydrogenase (short-subunit alcohol dehydrogenase family)
MSSQKVWFVTGASRGIGAETVKAALAAGDKVVATGRRLATVQNAFKTDADRLLPLELDVTDEQRAHAAVESAVARFGRIDVLVNNAAYGQLGLFEENTAAEIERQYATNVFGLFHVTRAVLPVMRRQRGGKILNLSSMAGMIGFAAASIYCSTKFAIEGYSESLALEVADFGIHVTIVEPGFIRTDFLDTSSVRYGSRRVDDYAAQAAELRARYDSYNHQQSGDPAKLASALVTLAAHDDPPLRYAAGSDAYQGISAKLNGLRASFEEWRDLSVSVDGRW